MVDRRCCKIKHRVQFFCCGIELVKCPCDFISFDGPIAERSPSRDYLLNTEIVNSKRQEEKMTAVPPDFSMENVRITSFEGWPSPFISPTKLAVAGFYYCPRSFDICGNMEPTIDDRVRCFSCGVELVKWEVGDEPIAEHKKWAPLCEFIQKF